MKKAPDNQPKLFQDEIPDKIKKASDDFHWRQFCKLGEMMGDGLHHEADGKWIAIEYKKLSRILIPEIRDVEKARRLRRIPQNLAFLIPLEIIHQSLHSETEDLLSWKCSIELLPTPARGFAL